MNTSTCPEILDWTFFLVLSKVTETQLSLYNRYLPQSSKKVPSSGPGQVDFLAAQVTFKAYSPNARMGDGPGKTSSN